MHSHRLNGGHLHSIISRHLLCTCAALFMLAAVHATADEMICNVENSGYIHYFRLTLKGNVFKSNGTYYVASPESVPMLRIEFSYDTQEIPFARAVKIWQDGVVVFSSYQETFLDLAIPVTGLVRYYVEWVAPRAVLPVVIASGDLVVVGDNAPPSVPSNPIVSSVGPTPAVYHGLYPIAYLRSNGAWRRFLLSWSPSTDSQSGLAGYSVSGLGSTGTPSLEFDAAPAEGFYYYQVTAVDNVQNGASAPSLLCIVDNSGPRTVDLSAAGAVITEPESATTARVTVNWSPVSDLPDVYNDWISGNSGVDRYVVRVGSQTKTVDAGAATTASFSSLARGVSYEVAVTAYDNLGNSTVCTVFVDTPPSAVGLADVRTDPTTRGPNGAPVYRNTVELDRGSAFFRSAAVANTVDHFEILRSLVANPAPTASDPGMPVMSYAPWQIAQWSVVGGRVSHAESTGEALVGAEFAHRAVTYRVKTVYKNGYIEYSAARPRWLGNYSASFEVLASKDAGDLGTVVANEATSTGPTFFVRDSSRARLCISTTTDIEGDILLLEAEYTPAGAAAPTASAAAANGVIMLDGILPSEGAGRIALAVCETNGGLTHATHTTVFDAVCDRTPPAFLASPYLCSQSPSQIVYDGSHHAPAAAIDIRDISAGDDLGAAQSGLKSLRIWNETGGVAAAAPVEIAWDGGAIDLPWTLEAEREGEQTVVLEVADNAGNVARRSLTTTFDATPPRVPLVLFPSSPSYDQIHDAIQFTWATFSDNLTSDEDLVYELTINGEPASAQQARSHEISAASVYPSNAPLPVSIRAVDRAGNRSLPAVYDRLYAPAELGKLEGTVDLAYAGAHAYTLTWRAERSSGADDLLRVGRIGSNGEDVVTDVRDASGAFVLSSVAPHCALTYQFVAVNSCGFETLQFTGQPSTWTSYTVPNAAPAKPVLAGPTELCGLLPVFSWGFEGTQVDRDGDSVTYVLLCRPSGAAEWPEAHRIVCTSPSVDSRDHADRLEGLLVDESRFEWKVVATDELGADSESDPASCTVDGKPPAVALSPPASDGNPFTNIRSLTVAAADAHGVAAVDYSFDDTLDSSGNEVVSHAEILHDADSYRATIPLHESRREATPGGERTYTVRVTVYDVAGNATTAAAGPIGVDFTPPAAPQLTLATAVFDGRAVSTTGSAQVIALAGDEFSGVGELQYGFVEHASELPDPWQAVALGSLDPEGNAETAEYTRVLEMSGGGRTVQNGRSYYLIARVIDWAGNTSESAASNAAVLVDTSPPAASVALAGTTASAGRLYSANPASLSLQASVSDLETGATAQYALIDEAGSGEPAGWQESWDGLLDALRPGHSFHIALRATNGVGAQVTARSRPFTYDPTAPTALTVAGDDLTDLVGGETVRITASARDPESGLRRLRLSIGTNTGGTDVSRAIPGNVEGFLVADDCSSSVEFVMTLPDLADGVYYLTIEATNGAGIAATNAGSESLITVNNARELLVVNGQGAFTSSRDTLRASWLYHGPRTPAGYRYRIVASPGTVLIGWTDTDSTWVVADGLALVHGESYHFEVEAIFEDGVPLDAAGPKVTVDLSLPRFAGDGGFVVPAASTSSGLAVEWSAADPESGIASAELILTAYDGSIHVAIELPGGIGKRFVSCDAMGRPLPLQSGEKVLLTLRATNGAGASVDRRSAAVMIDDTPPPTPVVVDQGEVINTSQYLSAQWYWTADDPESGTVGYRWAVVRDPGEIDDAQWHEGSPENAVDLSTVESADENSMRRDKAQWYFAVEATNGSGLRSIGFSNGIVYDATAPLVIGAKLFAAGGEAGNAPDLRYLSSRTALSLYIDAFEDLAQELTFTIESGSLTGGSWEADTSARVIVTTDQTVPLDDPSLIEPGRITVFRVLCRNEAGLVSQYGYTQGVLLDPAPPVIEAVNGRMSQDELLFDWDCAVGLTPVLHCLIALVPASEASQGPESWTDVGPDRTKSFRKGEEGIADGRYVLFVKACNAAGMESQPARSNVVTFDTSPPLLMSLLTPRYASASASMTAAAEDPESGIDGYQYAVGCFENGSLFSGGWIDLHKNATLLQDVIDLMTLSARIPDTSSIRISLRVRNGAGLWTDVEISRPLTIDRTPAERPLVDAGPYATHMTRIERIAYSTVDTQSGIRALRIEAVATNGKFDPGEAQLIAIGDDEHFVNPARALSYTLDGLDLAEASLYRIAMQAQNGAGDWSEIGYSGEVLVDTIAPTLSFENGEEGVTINYGPASLTIRLSERSTVAIAIKDDSGAIAELDPFDGPTGESTFEFPMTSEGSYVVSATAADAAGNLGNIGSDAATLSVRINAAPRIFFSGFETTPGRPLALTGHAVDPDGDYPLTYDWNFGDGKAVAGEAEPLHVYFHRSVADSSSRYILTLTVTDSLGKPATATTVVTVHNTSAGELCADEYWSGTHTMLGDVEVPEGLALTIVSGAAVEVSGPYCLSIDGVLDVESGASLRPPDRPGARWDGIVVAGSATIAGTTIAGAERAVTALPGSQVDIDSTDFADNLIGLHAYGSHPLVVNSRFEGSSQYGVKEDSGGEPRLTGCVFAGNLYDYYDQVETVIDARRLNELGINSGNSHE